MDLKDFAVIGACILVLAIALIADNGKPSAERSVEKSTPTQTVRKTESDNKPDTDKGTLAAYCEMAIKPQLKNPKSFDIDMHQTQLYDNDGTLVLDMFYYAENSYGATSINEAFCEFTTSGTLIKVLPVP